MKVNFRISSGLCVELEARWRCCCWTLVFAEVSLTSPGGLRSLGKVHQYVAPFFVLDHNWAREEENSTVSLQERGETEQHEAWSLFPNYPYNPQQQPLPASCNTSPPLSAANPLNSHLKEFLQYLPKKQLPDLLFSQGLRAVDPAAVPRDPVTGTSTPGKTLPRTDGTPPNKSPCCGFF